MTLNNHELFSIRVSSDMTKLHSEFSPNLNTIVSWAAGRQRGSAPIRLSAGTLLKIYLVSETARGLGMANGPYSNDFGAMYTHEWETSRTKVCDNPRIRHITEYATYYGYWERDLPRLINKIKDYVDNFRMLSGEFPEFSMGTALQIPHSYRTD